MMLGPGLVYLFETGVTFIPALVVMMSVDWKLTLRLIGITFIVVISGSSFHGP